MGPCTWSTRFTEVRTALGHAPTQLFRLFALRWGMLRRLCFVCPRRVGACPGAVVSFVCVALGHAKSISAIPTAYRPFQEHIRPTNSGTACQRLLKRWRVVVIVSPARGRNPFVAPMLATYRKLINVFLPRQCEFRKISTFLSPARVSQFPSWRSD